MNGFKVWDFSMMDRGTSDTQESRHHDLRISLSEDERYAKQHEALKKMAELLVETVDDVIEKMHKQALREGHSSRAAISSVYEDQREYHRRKLAQIILKEALDSFEKENP